MSAGYIKISKKDQNTGIQCRDLEVSGCERFFEKQVSSRKGDGSELRAALEFCREEDELVTWKLDDPFGGTQRKLIELVGGLKGRGVEFASLQESLDTTTKPGGSFVYRVFGAVAEFEEDLILERTMAHLEASRACGRHGSRPRPLDEGKVKLVRRLKDEDKQAVEVIYSMLEVGRSTLHRYFGNDSHERGVEQ